VKILLDTHVFLWLLAKPERLGKSISLAEDSRNELLVSAASSWEIAIKHGIGRLPLPEPPQRYVPTSLHAIGARGLPIEHTHSLAVASLPPLHRDPFDRLLVAQAKMLEIPLMTADPAIAQYPINTIQI
jgi:PIN domain nuclease of toxin-antitoxin system